MTVVQNDSIADVKNDVAQECVNNIFSEVMNFDHYSDLAHKSVSKCFNFIFSHNENSK